MVDQPPPSRRGAISYVELSALKMPTPFLSQDLGRTFDGRVLAGGRSLILAGVVDVRLDGDTISGTVQDRGASHEVSLTPIRGSRRLMFDQKCSCGTRSCVHLAAVGFAALDRFPELRQAEQQSFLDTLLERPQGSPTKPPTATAAPQPVSAPPATELCRVVFEVAPGHGPQAVIVTTLLVGVMSGAPTPSSPAQVLADARAPQAARETARQLGGGKATTGVPADQVDTTLALLARCGHARWHAGGQMLVQGETLVLPDTSSARLPPGSAIIVGSTGPWCIDAATGAVGRLRIRAPSAAARPAPPPAESRRPTVAANPEAPVIVDRKPEPTLRLAKFPCPDNAGRNQPTDGLLLEFDYGGGMIAFDDDKQFVKAAASACQVFVRRNKADEAAALDLLRQTGLVQVRMEAGHGTKGRAVLMFRGRNAPELWQAFVATRLPELEALGWRHSVDANFGPRMVESVGACDLFVADAAAGRFSLDLGIEIDGERLSLLPILMRLREQGGIAAARVVDGEIVTSLDDGRVARLPADRIGRILAIIGALAEASADDSANGTIVLDAEEASSVLDLEELVATRWEDGAAIAARVARFRLAADIPDVVVPPNFKAELRQYQRQGVNWLQHLRSEGAGALLADDMGLGKTAQTIAHIAVEQAEGRLDRPALVVVPTSLVPNWTAELTRFAPGLRVLVLHGMDRHEKRQGIFGADVVVTTYAVLSRDIEEMVEIPWHMVVLDEAQAIKSPLAQATRAVCRLDARHRLCLSGTPIENNLGELWSLFAFLSPGLLGSRKTFTRRFRTPIERDGDRQRRHQLATRIRPFILRRTKGQVVTELPPKHTILRRVTLPPEQRDLYEAIRATMQARVTQEIASRGLARSHVVVLDALLKLRQACCDPRLLKLPSGTPRAPSGKLDELMEMLGEMVAEGRRVLLFSQFTSMLDLLKPALDAVGTAYVELRGDTTDRAAPVRRFEAGEVPLFLISLKAGGRGLNLVSADTVIHYDPWWNPAVEDQASDRAHRIGQTKSVFIYKLVAADTVEERILELQERKADLARLAFGGEGGGLEGIGDDDIDFLFASEERRSAA
jgi:superfamily II DNA or RNA helicase